MKKLQAEWDSRLSVQVQQQFEDARKKSSLDEHFRYRIRVHATLLINLKP